MLEVRNDSQLRDVIAVANKPMQICLWDERIISANKHVFKKIEGKSCLDRPSIISSGDFLEDDEKLEALITKLLELNEPFTSRVHSNGEVCTLRWTISVKA